MGLDVTPMNGDAGARRPRAFPAMKVRILFIKASYKSKAPLWQTGIVKVKGIRDRISGFPGVCKRISISSTIDDG